MLNVQRRPETLVWSFSCLVLTNRFGVLMPSKNCWPFATPRVQDQQHSPVEIHQPNVLRKDSTIQMTCYNTSIQMTRYNTSETTQSLHLIIRNKHRLATLHCILRKYDNNVKRFESTRTTETIYLQPAISFIAAYSTPSDNQEFKLNTGSLNYDKKWQYS